MEEYFSFDNRLGIQLPDLNLNWEHYNQETQHSILFHWEKVRGSIPDRIAELEDNINQKQAMLSDESDFPRSCELNSEIADLASVINDLWIWYRANQTVSKRTHQ
ncbi:MAG: hypothetical protein Q8934_15320 [Bacillota bacterium]|nr:hypothetical protein [Bacillota bacterium]